MPEAEKEGLHFKVHAYSDLRLRQAPGTDSGVPDWERFDEPSYTRRGRRIPILTGTEQEAESQLLDVRYRARTSVWTTRPPNAAGWWWVRETQQTVGIPVRVEQIGRELRWSVQLERWQPVTTPGLCWSDMPITEPRTN